MNYCQGNMNWLVKYAVHMLIIADTRNITGERAKRVKARGWEEML